MPSPSGYLGVMHGFKGGRPFAALLAAPLVACTGARSAAPLNAPVPAATQEARAVAPVPPLEVELDATGATIGGTRVESSALDLRGALARHRGNSPTARVRLHPDLSGTALARLLQAAAGTELTSVTLVAGERTLEVGVAPPASEPACTIASPVAGASPERRFPVSCSGDRAGSGNLSAAFVPGDAGSERRFRDLLTSACGSDACVVRVALAVDAEHADVIHVLEAYQRATAELPRLALYFRAADVRGATTVSGRLPPEVIQRVVRQNFSVFRKCYELGLARDPNLQGRVTTRFVIGRDGKVSHVSDQNSDIPDAEVRECVLNSFYKLEFPEPEGGIVTVVYPIQLAPN